MSDCGFPEYSSNGLVSLIVRAFTELAKRRYDYAQALQRYQLADILKDEMTWREMEIATKEEADPYSVINGGKGEAA